MATYTVERRYGGYYVNDLPDGNYSDTLLLYRHPGNDVDAPFNRKTMLGALCDLFQTNDNLTDGDSFKTPFGRFVCGGHVVSAVKHHYKTGYVRRRRVGRHPKARY